MLLNLLQPKRRWASPHTMHDELWRCVSVEDTNVDEDDDSELNLGVESAGFLCES